MRRSRRLALTLAVCALGAPVAAYAQDATTPTPAKIASPFKADRQGSTPTGLTPNTVATPFRYPTAPVILGWGEVPGAKSYTVEVSDTPGFGTPVWEASTARPVAVPEILLPDGQYWWRVKAVDAAGTVGATSDVARFQKTWVAPTVANPADGAVTHDLRLQWAPVDGAEQYEIQVSDLDHNWTGQSLKISATTSTNGFVPTLSEEQTRNMSYGDLWWRVRPRSGGAYGAWSSSRKITWQSAAPGVRTAVAQLSSSGDTDTGLSPMLAWTPVTGATVYRVDIASDPQFADLVERQFTTSTSWASRKPLDDNQIGAGYYWRVLWGNGSSIEDPGLMVDEADVASASFRKQTRVVPSTAGNAGVVSEAPLLSWASVPGIANYEVQLSSDGTFVDGVTRSASVQGLGGVPGSLASTDRRLPDGTWGWRVRAVDGANHGQTWSPVRSFTLNSPRVAPSEPADGASVVYAPTLRWNPVTGACGYDVDVSPDPSFPASAAADQGLQTAQTAFVPPSDSITTPGRHYWRVRADYCGDIKGQWSPTRNFRSVFPPDFNLNSIPSRVDYRTQVVVGGALRNNGAGVSKARVYLERRLYPSDTYRPAGMIRTGPGGKFRLALKMSRSADYRLVWREDATHPEGIAAFAIDVAPRVTFRLASNRVVRRSGLLVKGSVYPRRPAVIQLRTADGWQTIRKVAPRRDRFAVSVSTRRLDPGTHRLRLWVPRDAQRRFANASSRQRGVLVYDKFVIR